MPTSRSGRPRAATSLLALSVFVLVVALLGACSSGGSGGGAAKGSDKTTSTSSTTSTLPSTTEPGTAATPGATAEAAVKALLDAEIRGDHATSYRLLSSAARKGVGDVSDWIRLRNEVPAIVRFTIEPTKKSGQVATVVEHKPALDPFVGLTPAKERQTWTAVREGGGWLVEAEPAVEYVLPPDTAVAPAVKAWAAALQACDQRRAARSQAVAELYGTSASAAKLCRSSGAITVGTVGPLEAGPDSADLVAQYSQDALEWARTVKVTAPSGPFTVIVAPFGDTWKVLGLAE